MCGIYGLLTTAEHDNEISTETFFDCAERLLACADQLRSGPIADVSAAVREDILAALAAAHEATFTWVQRTGFLTVLRDDAMRARLAEYAARIEKWVQTVDEVAQASALSAQRDWEFVNQLTVGGKDIVWQIERDCLANLEAVRELAPAAGAEGSDPLVHAWQIHLVLSSLNRLEVRGRDSAGVAIYVRFQDSEHLERFLDTRVTAGTVRDALLERDGSQTLSASTIVRPASDASVLLFAFKVASEIGRMGDNVAELRRAIVGDEVFGAALAENGTEVQCLAHTRWASNGIISQSNCHPRRQRRRSARRREQRRLRSR